MHFNFPHNTSAAHATARIKTALMQQQGELAKHVTIKKQEWEGNTLNFAFDLQGKTITGTVAITEREYVIDATLPLLWRMFEGKIEKEIRNQVGGILQK
ncbi:MAG: polyhydroxyalkanoic acid system family protein [Patescibacteria group bacterium]